MILELFATACAGFFSGAALYISVVQHPASLQLGTAAATRFFAPMYARAAPLQASLAGLGVVAGAAVWWSGGGWPWLLGALLLGAVIPFTMIVIMPTNSRLKDPALDAASPEAAALLRRWGTLHAVRSVASGLAFLTFLYAMARG